MIYFMSISQPLGGAPTDCGHEDGTVGAHADVSIENLESKGILDGQLGG